MLLALGANISSYCSVLFDKFAIALVRAQLMLIQLTISPILASTYFPQLAMIHYIWDELQTAYVLKLPYNAASIPSTHILPHVLFELILIYMQTCLGVSVGSQQGALFYCPSYTLLNS